MAKRFYAQYTTERCLPAGFPAWHIFDREWTVPQGECLPIARCLSRQIAFTIRDALNTKTGDK